MNQADFKRAFALADSTADLSHVDDSILHGCALSDFQPVSATIEVVAAFLRWQALHIMYKEGGSRWDQEELNNLRNLFRYKVTLLN